MSGQQQSTGGPGWREWNDLAHAIAAAHETPTAGNIAAGRTMLEQVREHGDAADWAPAAAALNELEHGLAPAWAGWADPGAAGVLGEGYHEHVAHLRELRDAEAAGLFEDPVVEVAPDPAGEVGPDAFEWAGEFQETPADWATYRLDDNGRLVPEDAAAGDADIVAGVWVGDEFVRPGDVGASVACAGAAAAAAGVAGDGVGDDFDDDDAAYAEAEADAEFASDLGGDDVDTDGADG